MGRSRAAWDGRGPPAEMSQVSRAPGPPCKVVAWSREAVAAWIEWMGGTQGVDLSLGVPKVQRARLAGMDATWGQERTPGICGYSAQ